MESLSWLSGDELVAGCRDDHAIKVVDIEKSFVIKQSIQTDYKTPCSLDTAQDSLVLAGCEDCVIRLWDLRSNEKGKYFRHSYSGHS